MQRDDLVLRSGLILVEVEKLKLQSESGLFIRSLSSDERSNIGIVVKSGEPGVYAGDSVLLRPYTGTSIILDDLEYLVVNVEDVLGTFSK